ncbi:Ohr family peroxiredoxin [Lichenicoccus roseus]|uniref:Ohr family peroxiredoxin n=1 Tax=Lichenicoccus roseus TaxID=2683649 RepID=UPI00197DBE8A|nr:Ohr family peroxiredoxin [Lichenicoccus roseus]
MAFTTEATTIAGRNGHVDTGDGVLSLDLAVPRPDGTPSNPAATNPEALFAAGYSACFGQAVLAAAELEHLKPENVAVTAVVTLQTENRDFRLSVILRTKIDGVDRKAAETLVQRAHELCPYSKATRNNIPVELEVL